MTAKDITETIALRGGQFGCRNNFLVLANLSWSFLPWEADLIVVSKSWYVTEIEIKVSVSDWRADAAKDKFRLGSTTWKSEWRKIKRFFYAVPRELIGSADSVGMPEWAGLLAVTGESYPYVEVIRPAVSRPDAMKLGAPELLNLCRVGAKKAWYKDFVDWGNHGQSDTGINSNPDRAGV